MPREMSEYSICRSEIGCTPWARRSVAAPTSERPIWRTCPAFTRSAIAPTVSSIGTFRIEPRRPVDVDVIRAEPAQGVGEEVPERHGARVDAREHAGEVAQRAELDADDHLIARLAAERIADQHLVVAHAVEIAGVEQRDPGIERRMDGRDALRPVGRAIEIRHAHAAEARARRRAGPRNRAFVLAWLYVLQSVRDITRRGDGEFQHLPSPPTIARRRAFRASPSFAPPGLYAVKRVSSKEGTAFAKASSQATSLGWLSRHFPSKRRSW